MIFAPVSLALIEEASIVAGQRLVDVADGPGNMIEEEQTNCRELEFGAFCQFIFLHTSQSLLRRCSCLSYNAIHRPGLLLALRSVSPSKSFSESESCVGHLSKGLAQIRVN